MRLKNLEKEKVVQIACGAIHSMIRTNLGRVFSCGNGSTFALGHGTRDSLTSFRVVDLPENEIKFIKDYVCVFPAQVIQQLVPFSKGAIEYYTTNHFVYTIPHKYMNDEIYKDKVWGSTLLNTVKPF